MKRAMGILLLVVCAAMCADAGDLIIRKDGTSFWVSRFSKKGSTIRYRSEVDGPIETIAVKDLDMVVPSVKRGKNYTPAQIDKGLSRAKRAIRKHPRLRKQIEVIKQQWESLQDGTSDQMAGEIKKLTDKFGRSDKSPKVFEDIALQLQMLAFKDAAGRHSDSIEKTLQTMHRQVFDTHYPKLESMVGAADQTVANYEAAKALADSLKMAKTTTDEKGRLDKLVERCRKNTIASALKLAKGAFFETKDVDGYLKSMGILGDIENCGAAKPEDTAEAQKIREIVKSAAARECEGYTFTTNGFPLDKVDLALPEIMKQSASLRPSGYEFGRSQHCYLMPTRMPNDANAGEQVSVPVRIIFNRTPLEGIEYHLLSVFSVPGASAWVSSEPINVSTIRSGHIQTAFSAAVPKLVPRISNPQKARWNGRTTMGLFVAYKANRTGYAEKKDWVSASGICYFGFGPARR